MGAEIVPLLPKIQEAMGMTEHEEAIALFEACIAHAKMREAEGKPLTKVVVSMISEWDEADGTGFIHDWVWKLHSMTNLETLGALAVASQDCSERGTNHDLEPDPCS